MQQLLHCNQLVLMEAAIVERLRRSHRVTLHPTLLNATLIYDPVAARIMAELYREYAALAERAALPLLLCAPTWRANQSRVESAAVSETINQDAVHYMRGLFNPQHCKRSTIKIGGMIGCKNDCYRPQEALSTDAAEQFHAWQLQHLATAGVDFLLAETLPELAEALGIARAMVATGLPYIISFVIGRDGKLLDGNTLVTAIALIDAGVDSRPLGYMVNCAHPSFLHPELLPQSTLSRLVGYQANASSLDHCDLDNADTLKSDDLQTWGQLMSDLNKTFGVQILGGCCGTGLAHLERLVDAR